MEERKFETSWSRLAEAGDLAGAVVDFIRTRDHVSFVELQREFESYMPTRGRLAWIFEGNIVLWASLTPELFALLEGLVKQERVFFHPAHWMVYAADGCMLRLPLCKKPPKGGYKKEHWLPTCLRVVPIPEKRGRPRA